jgi:hypothetical protein
MQNLKYKHVDTPTIKIKSNRRDGRGNFRTDVHHFDMAAYRKAAMFEGGTRKKVNAFLTRIFKI